ncbi:hypothetical protein ACLQ85_07170 [Gallibacterium anatis]|uniref:hypothetical protein n=1 Tax=Gallibacterium anatis TaxID=750 RepID=UPI0039FBBE37
MIIDRPLQYLALKYLKDNYPNYIDDNIIYRHWKGLPEVEDDYNAQFLALQESKKYAHSELRHLRENLVYLSEHSLVETLKDGYSYKITAKGIDFIENDGGLSTILNVTTVKLHPSTLELLTQVINASSLNPSDKQKLLDQLKSLPVDSIKQILTELVSKGRALFLSIFQ